VSWGFVDALRPAKPECRSGFGSTRWNGRHAAKKALNDLRTAALEALGSQVTESASYQFPATPSLFDCVNVKNKPGAEPRMMLAVVSVNTRQDIVDPNDQFTSLREAVEMTNGFEGSDEIVFDFGHDRPMTI
jgi:hypothetical protein